MKFILEEQERAILKNPLGKLYKSIQEMPLSNSKPIISIGDSSSKQLLDFWAKPVLCVIDNKTKRTEPGIDLKPTRTVKNPAGCVTDDLWNAIRDTKSGVIVVDGEEDLAVLPALFLSEPGSQIIYGQPDEGLVLVEVNDTVRQRFGKILLDWQVRQGRKLLEQIRPTSSVYIIHHSDADGCCSGAILHKYLTAKGVSNISTTSPRFSPRIGEKTQKRISNDAPDFLIVTDLGSESSEYLTTLSKTTPVLIIDHHGIYNESFGRSILVNPCNLNLPPSFNPSASYLCHLVTEGSDWITVVGTYGDKGESKIVDLSKRVKDSYNLTDEHILKAAYLIDSAEETAPGYAEKAIKALINSHSPEDLLSNPELNEFAQEIQKEIDATLSSYKENATFDDTLGIITLQIQTQFNIKSAISNFLQSEYPDKIILIYEERGGKTRVSLRTVNRDTNFPELIRKATKGIPAATGGGHAKAAGANIPTAQFQVFLENFKRELKNE